VRDLLGGPRRHSDLLAGLPCIQTNVLASRLKEPEEDGLVVREAPTGSDRPVVYRATARVEEIQAALNALGRWGAAGMREPRKGEVVTDASLVGSLRVAGQGGTRRRVAARWRARSGSARPSRMPPPFGKISVAPDPDPAPDVEVGAAGSHGIATFDTPPRTDHGSTSGSVVDVIFSVAISPGYDCDAHSMNDMALFGLVLRGMRA
jgi:DNA-binding HxlR family transcriptional regulator